MSTLLSTLLGRAPVTPAAADASAIVTGAVAVTVFAANSIATRARIVNPMTAAAQGIAAAESLFVTTDGSDPNLTGTGTTVELLPGGALKIENPLTTAVKAKAATASHRFSAVKE